MPLLLLGVGNYLGPETQFKLVAVDRSRVINVPGKLFQRLSMPTNNANYKN